MCQELRKLLTKKRLENKSVTFASEVEMHEHLDSERGQDSEVEKVNTINIDKLLSVSYEVTAEDMDGVLQFCFTICYFSLHFIFPYIIPLDPQT
jgi:hypothetical protein